MLNIKLIIHLHFVSRLRICGGMFPLLPLPSLWLVQVIACMTEFALILTLLETTSFFLFKLRVSVIMSKYVCLGEKMRLSLCDITR